MKRGGRIILALALAACLPAQAQAPPSPGYRPGLGDLMTATVQPRHIKLGLAGQQKNWAYADYELHELQEAFERAASVWPTWRGVPVAQMIEFNTKEPIASIGQAIKAGDAERFDKAYKQLTEACDTCHQGAGRAMIVIKVPDASMFPDQDFRAPAK
ncbi:MAG TPA: hypothetical protein VN802_08210 [Stellaceae bacterium]|nr:hypothetical protein [Stellaceae bacterium]